MTRFNGHNPGCRWTVLVLVLAGNARCLFTAIAGDSRTVRQMKCHKWRLALDRYEYRYFSWAYSSRVELGDIIVLFWSHGIHCTNVPRWIAQC